MVAIWVIDVAQVITVPGDMCEACGELAGHATPFVAVFTAEGLKKLLCVECLKSKLAARIKEQIETELDYYLTQE